jgi:hypothetical protein
MPEYRTIGENVSPASLVLPLVCRVSPASALRHRLHSGTGGHGLVRYCPAMGFTMVYTSSGRFRTGVNLQGHAVHKGP